MPHHQKRAAPHSDDDRFNVEEPTALVEHGLLDHLICPQCGPAGS